MINVSIDPDKSVGFVREVLDAKKSLVIVEITDPATMQWLQANSDNYRAIVPFMLFPMTGPEKLRDPTSREYQACCRVDEGPFCIQDQLCMARFTTGTKNGISFICGHCGLMVTQI